MSKRQTNFKEPMHALTWLDAALEMEKKKYAALPVARDMVPEYEMASAWAYVVSGYFLVEQALKLLLHLRKQPPKRTHTLSSELFSKLPANDQDVLREYYLDYRSASDGMTTFPFSSLDDFLINLDGKQDKRGMHLGSFAWRYFLIEETNDDTMPTVSIEFLHEIAYGLIVVVEQAIGKKQDPSKYTYSHRSSWRRKKTYESWLNSRMSSDERNTSTPRLALLWGPDYRERCDFFLFDGAGKSILYFDKMPHDRRTLVVDLRRKLQAFCASRVGKR